MFDSEFNPKGWSLLDEQLAESGIEMSVDPGTAMLIGSAISGGTAILGGIFGSNSAKDANRQAEKSYKEQMKLAQQAADATNAYNKRAHAVDIQNYQNNREYAHETNLAKWRYEAEIQDLQFKSVVEQYGRSVENTESRLTYNNIAAMQAYESEQAALNDIFTEDTFSRQGALVDQLQNEGRAALGQAGNSRTKALQSSIAALGRNSAIMDASLSSSVEQSQRNMRQINLQRYAADVNARAQMMIRPTRTPGAPLPTQAPERIFIEPMTVLPQAIQAPIRQSTSAPLVSGFIGAAGSIGGAMVNYGANNYQSPVPQIGSTGGGSYGASAFNLNANYGGF